MSTSHVAWQVLSLVTLRQSAFYPRATVSRDEVSAGSSRVITAQVIPSFTCPLLLLFATTVPQLPANTIRTAEVKMAEISPDYAQRTVGTGFQRTSIFCLYFIRHLLMKIIFG
jgi:hypothetical protein